VDFVVVLIVAFVFVGALMQRTTGMGFAMVAGPFLVVLLDPVAGVVLVNACGVLSSLVVLSRTFREVRWKRVAVLAVGALLGTIPGALVTTMLPQDAVRIFIGALIIAALTVSLLGSRFAPPVRPSPTRSATAGFCSGFMSGSAGVGGPAMSVYAIMTRWDQRSFAATLQPYFVLTGLMAIIAKIAFDPSAVPMLPGAIWVAIVAALLLGQVAGEFLSRVLPVQTARVFMIVLAYFGGTVTVAFGLAGALG
jgi:uncharacterized protein